MTPRKGKKTKKKKKVRSGLEQFAVLAVGLVLALCAASVVGGFAFRLHKEAREAFPKDVRIEVLNGTGRKGLARQAALALMKKKVDVLRADNADSFDYEESIFIVRKRRPEVESLGEMLGCKRMVEQLKSDAMVDATLVIGSDFETLNLEVDVDSSLPE